MTIIEILDGLAELGRLRLERERAEQQAAQAQSSGAPATDNTQQVSEHGVE